MNRSSLVVKSLLICSLVSSQAFAGNGQSPAPATKPSVSFNSAFSQADGSTPLYKTAQLAGLSGSPMDLNTAVKLGFVTPQHVAHAQKMINELNRQGINPMTVTKADFQKMLPNLQEQNPLNYLVALLPLAVAFIGIAMMDHNKQTEIRRDNEAQDTYQKQRIERAQAEIAEANARAARAEAAAKEAEARAAGAAIAN